MNSLRVVLQEKIKEQLGKYSTDKKLLFVFLGISYEYLKGENQIFPTELGEKSIEDLNKIDKRSLFLQIAKKMESPQRWFGITYEEYEISQKFIDSTFYVAILKNNLYHNYFPLQVGNDSWKENIFNTVNEDDNSSDENMEESNELKVFHSFYGDIKKLKFNYYVSLNNNFEEEKRIVNLFDATRMPEIKIDERVNSRLPEYELSFSDTEMLDLTEKILKQKLKGKIQIIIKNNERNLPNNSYNRVKILNQIFKDNIKIVFVPKTLEKKKIIHSQEYHEILNKYWGFNDFRDLKMYANIADTRNKETKVVSQEQIIDDLVEESEKALRGESYRDIYVTAPTGAGKSLMFQLPALYLAKKYPDKKPLTIVISPLIGLMNDQVESMKNKNITTSRTIHSNLSIFEKNKILDEVWRGKVDILYMSTETLQNKTDIKALIGDRQIGLFVVDEAHIVTTWGKTFRADYWYMGIYLQKLRKEYNFPIATFTATAIYGGPEDMYSETRDSLNLGNPISYFGYVKRDNIEMHIKSSERDYENYNRDYRHAKMLITYKRIQAFIQRNQKTLIYFPTVKLLNDFYYFVERESPNLFKLIGRYYGSLDKNEKEAAYLSFKSGNKKIMLATKAFGMGIDIPDIDNVYHFAPTGTVVDYIQEIGRAARHLLKGYAWVDFLKYDFTEVNRLYGMSAVRKGQIIAVMKKIIEIYKNKKSRNIVVSADDFRYLVDSNQDKDDSNIDNQIKIILLMIEKDFEQKLGYSPFYARPKQVFGKELIFVNQNLLNLYDENNFKNYLEKIDDLENYKNYTAIYEPDLFTKICKIPIKHMHHAFDGYFAFSPFKCTKRASALV